MEQLWVQVLGLVRQGDIQQVTLKFVDTTGALVERRTAVSSLQDNSVESGIVLDTGEVVFPNPTTAILNPFLSTPTIAFICDLKKRPYDPVLAEASEEMPLAPSIFPVIVAGRPAVDMELQAQAMQQMRVRPAMPLAPRSPVNFIAADGDDANDDNAEVVDVQPRTFRGTSCHQCKNARSIDHLAFCQNLFNRRSRQDKRRCRKKFCDLCLGKCYGDSIANSKRKGWICPSCSGICRCAACTRIRRKDKSDITPLFHDVSPLSFPGVDMLVSGLTSVGGGSGGGCCIAPDFDNVDSTLGAGKLGKVRSKVNYHPYESQCSSRASSPKHTPSASKDALSTDVVA